MKLEFEYEWSHQITEEEYSLIHSDSRPWKNERRVALTVVGILSLFWQYTFLLGFVLLVLSIISIFLPQMLPYGSRFVFRHSQYLRERYTYHLDGNKLEIYGDGLYSSFTWKRLKVWREVDGFLILSTHNFQPLYFKIEELKKADVYDSVMLLANKYGKKFGSGYRVAN